MRAALARTCVFLLRRNPGRADRRAPPFRALALAASPVPPAPPAAADAPHPELRGSGVNLVSKLGGALDPEAAHRRIVFLEAQVGSANPVPQTRQGGSSETAWGTAT